MLNRDYPFVIADLEKRTEAIEKVFSTKTEKNIDNEDWDNAQLMQKWQISKRTTANYRNQGLEYYKVGGRIYYTPEQREKFVAKSKTEKLNINEKVGEDKKSMREEVSFYENFGDKGQTMNLLEIIDAVKNGKFETQIDNLRSLKKEDVKFGELKKRLPHFTPSGTFNERRSAGNLTDYSGVMVLDIDKVGEKVEEIKNKAAEVEFTMAAFISPSGEGVKILVKTDSNPEIHESFFNSVATYYEETLGVSVDQSGKDISRACFISHDPALYCNEESVVFSATNITPLVKFSTANTTYELEDIYQKVVDFTENIDSYGIGNRNNFIYKLANNLNRAGIEKNAAKKLLMENYAEPDVQKGIPSTVESAYSHTHEHGKFDYKYFDSASFARSASFATAAKGTETPVISQEVYNRLPEFLKDCTSMFSIDRERDMFLTGALSNLSGCFNNVEGKYDRRLYSPNLYSFIIAPPASGKGVVNFCRQLPSTLHKELNNAAEANSLVFDDKNVQPKGLFIPADSSSAAIKRLLVANNEQGIICETEADTLSVTLAQDWGGFDDLLRKAFQHEPVTFSRIDKDSNEVKLREINRPKLSVCLTGTPSQVSTLLKSTENGLFSRFMFYKFQNNNVPAFKNVFADNDELSLEEFFEEKAKVVHEMYQKANSIGKCRFSFTNTQHEEFLNQFNKRLKEMHFEYGEETQGIVFRLGLITFRIAMLLSVLRTLENDTFSESIVCCDDDFNISIELSDIYLQHSMAVFKSLPLSKKVNQNAMTLLNYLPDEFSYSEAEKIGDVFCNIKTRSISTHLKKLVECNMLIQPKENGLYYKPGLQ
jgi:hypothetical protein